MHDELYNADQRRLFDSILEEILAELPAHIHDLLEEVPLIVEDYPSPRLLDELGIGRRGMLCGLHSGIPLTERSVMQSGVPDDTIYIYREGIFNLAADPRGRVAHDRLHDQIRITVLHEIGHHFGLDEDDLDALGYA